MNCELLLLYIYLINDVVRSFNNYKINLKLASLSKNQNLNLLQEIKTLQQPICIGELFEVISLFQSPVPKKHKGKHKEYQKQPIIIFLLVVNMRIYHHVQNLRTKRCFSKKFYLKCIFSEDTGEVYWIFPSPFKILHILLSSGSLYKVAKNISWELSNVFVSCCNKLSNKQCKTVFLRCTDSNCKTLQAYKSLNITWKCFRKCFYQCFVIYFYEHFSTGVVDTHH